MKMNQEQFESLIRSMLISLGMIGVGKYYDQSTLIAFVGALVTIAMTGWGIYVKRKAGLLISAVTSVPNTKIVTTDALANATPDHPNIVSSNDNLVVPKVA
jgi:hypothetical protein